MGQYGLKNTDPGRKRTYRTAKQLRRVKMSSESISHESLKIPENRFFGPEIFFPDFALFTESLAWTQRGSKITNNSQNRVINEVTGRCDSFERSKLTLRATVKDPEKSPKNRFFLPPKKNSRFFSCLPEG